VVSRRQVQFAILQFQLPWLCRCGDREFSFADSRGSSFPQILAL